MEPGPAGGQELTDRAAHLGPGVLRISHRQHPTA
ncbi:hypothetical protein J2S57_006294 [Kineosporia succinea]|uniref:Uncharacterized protein n=1 Tax=Kineosporia succinea TaxID=84632 RepID=A0ABT9PCX1_9ACTN|nr:hypothetical protein [Kineosporia succinea]